MGFEVFDKRLAPLTKAPSITIQKRGIFSLNGAARKLINDADTVELLFDREKKIIGVRPAEASPHAYQIRPQSSGRGAGVAILSATAFTQYYDIDTTESRRYEPYLQDEMLCINLEGRNTVVQGNRARKADATDDT